MSTKNKGSLPIDLRKLDIPNNFPFKFKINKNKKNYIVASQDINAGTLVFFEASHCYIIENKYKSLFQYSFSNPFQRSLQHIDSVEPKNIKELETSFGKRLCSFCNEWCDGSNEIRSLQCIVLEKLRNSEYSSKVDFDRFNFVLKLIELTVSRLSLDSADDPKPKDFGSASLDLIETMPIQMGLQGRYWQNRVNFEASLIIQWIPSQIHLQLRQLQKTNLRNIYKYFCLYEYATIGFYDLYNNSINIAKGLFPLFSLCFKHSCMPNCTFEGNSNGVLAVRSLIDIKAESVLCISKTEIYQPRYTRRRDLFFKHRFWCNCTRCAIPLIDSPDNSLDGVLCPKCKSGIMITVKKLKTQNLIDQGKAGINRNSDRDSDPVSDPDSDLDSDSGSSSIKKQLDTVSCCSKCSHLVDLDAVENTRRLLSRDYTRAIKTYQYTNEKVKCSSPSDTNTKTSGDSPGEYQNSKLCYEKPINMFENILVHFESNKKVSPYNCHLINIHKSLISCYRMTSDYFKALTHCKHVLTTVETSQSIPSNWPEIIYLRITLGKLYIKAINAMRKDNAHIPMFKIKNYYKKAKIELAKAKHETCIAFGSQHNLVTTITALIEIVSRGPTDVLHNQSEADGDAKKQHRSNSEKLPHTHFVPNKGKSSTKFTSAQKPKGLVKQPPHHVPTNVPI